MTLRMLLMVAALLPAGAASAACPQALAVYREAGGESGLEFTPATRQDVRNAFRLLLPGRRPLEGEVAWPRAGGQPEGRLAASGAQAGGALWHGAIQAIDRQGRIGPLPAADEDAAERLILVDLSQALRSGVPGGAALPGIDVYSLSGCQE